MKVFKILVLVFFLFAIHYSLYANSAYADECSNIDSNEFHSLRPYPEKSCIAATENYAKFCGNTLTLQSEITVPYTPGVDKCTPIAGGKVRCSYVKQGGGNITIDLSNANLPIMGNTEDVTPHATPDMSNAQKVNEYVSWYLNGINNRAEYLPTEDGRKIIDFSGPINKLLPEKIQRKARVATIESAGDTHHDQIVGCVYNLLGLFKVGQIVECYPKTIDKSVMRLSDWEKNNHIPPNEEEYENYGDYLIALKRWRGESCITLSGISLCFDNPLKPNYWGNLFQNIPLSSTEDLEGNIKIDSVSVGGIAVSNVSFTGQSPATLFFPHIQESDELGSILQDTYLAKGEAKTGADTAVEPPSSCKTVDVRSNKGDSLHAGEISGKLSYTASFTCDFNPPTCSSKPLTPKNRFCETEFSGTCVPSSWGCSGTFPNSGCPAGYKCGSSCSCDNQSQSCTKTFPVTLSTLSNTPKINDVWSRLVAGPTAIVKRLFPKLGTQIGTLKDLPGSTGITYSGDAQGSGELNLPHIGGISEYFLKGIQTLLRPKGYGEPISFGSTTTDTKNKFGDIDCDQSAPDVSLPKTVSKETLHQMAIRWEGREGDHVLECYNDVVRKSLAAGISPAFTFLMWLNESGGSNYNISNQDWGINSNKITGFAAQLERFLQLPSGYKNNYPQCFGKTKTDTEVYFDLFAVGLQGGQCVPGAGQHYIDLLNAGWNWFTTCPTTSFPFSSSCY